MSISVHTGNPRNGKTYGLTKMAIRCLDEGEIVYSNYKIEWKGKKGKRWSWEKFKKDVFNPREEYEYPESNLRYWGKLSDLYDVKNGIILMDEAHVYLNSRKWADLPEDFERKLYQHGKDGLHIVGTVQNVRRLDTVMRELIDYWYVYVAFPKPPQNPWKKHRPRWFIKYQIEMESDLVRQRYLAKTRVIFFRKKLADMYNTLEKIKIKKEGER